MPTRAGAVAAKKALPRIKKIRAGVVPKPAIKKIPYPELTAFQNRINRGVTDLEAGIGVLQGSFAGKYPLARDIYATRSKTPVRVQALEEGTATFIAQVAKLQAKLAELSGMVSTRTQTWISRPN